MSKPVSSCAPPVSSGPNSGDSVNPSVGMVGGQPTPTTLLGLERTRGASSPACRPEGGDR